MKLLAALCFLFILSSCYNEQEGKNTGNNNCFELTDSTVMIGGMSMMKGSKLTIICDSYRLIINVDTSDIESVINITNNNGEVSKQQTPSKRYSILRDEPAMLESVDDSYALDSAIKIADAITYDSPGHLSEFTPAQQRRFREIEKDTSIHLHITYDDCVLHFEIKDPIRKRKSITNVAGLTYDSTVKSLAVGREDSIIILDKEMRDSLKKW